MGESGSAAEVLQYEGKQPDERFRIGTLLYTPAGLVFLFVWLLWGDFCLTLMEAILPAVLPLQLKAVGASSLTISVMVFTIPSILNFFVVPIVGFWSDGYRSRWGRRVPFIVGPLPFLVLFLGLLGFVTHIGRHVSTMTLPAWLPLSNGMLVTIVIGGLVVGFQLFNMVVWSIYYCLFADVVPRAFLGRFMSLFRVVGAIAGFLFHTFVFRFADSHAHWIYLGVAVLFAAGFLLMSWRVKEGEYPTPPADRHRPGFFENVRKYFRECFTHWYYICFFLAFSMWSASIACNLFTVFLLRDALGIGLDTVGKVSGIGALLGTIVYYFYGILVDRFHPLRVCMAALFMLIPITAATFFFLEGYRTFILFTVLTLPVALLFHSSALPLSVAILPKERYGQFSSAMSMVRSAVTIAFTALGGLFMDFVTSDGADPDRYRWLYLWTAFFQLAMLLFLVPVYVGWIRFGGHNHYRAP